jgi:hypothetical protein
MREDLQQKLMDEFPWFEACNVWTGEKCGFPTPCSHGDGWYNLIYNICKELQEYYNSIDADINELYILQIKEKWGRLCFYIGSYYGDADKIIGKYEHMSKTVCETCGENGETQHRGSWLRTLCDKCASEQGYVKFKENEEI